MLSALVLSFGVVFVAELGDRSQLMAMMFAMRYRSWMVIAAITTATAGIHLFSVAVGHYLGASIPMHLTSVVAGLAMIVFGLWTIRGDTVDGGLAGPARVGASAFFAVTSVFFLAELGDKTMFTTIALATDNNWLGVWIGSTLGMVAADALAIVLGSAVVRHLPPKVISRGAAALFFGFAVWLLWSGLDGASAELVFVTVVIAGALLVAGAVVIRRDRARRDRAPRDPALRDRSPLPVQQAQPAEHEISRR